MSSFSDTNAPYMTHALFDRTVPQGVTLAQLVKASVGQADMWYACICFHGGLG